ncbi:MAG TPA: TetR/AcrR family transcriptional regulator [Gemmatimonadaceae bacterium]|nr:TetR/AcrR family transcriptional regulator [Gemmatimonadaceae bacterium]
MITKKSSRRRGRPRTFDRDAALDAAVRLFWRNGYEGTSIADLTAAMGVAPPTLYANFGAKEDLYRAALARYFECEGWGARLEHLKREPSAYRAVEVLLRTIARELVNPATPVSCMIAAAVWQTGPENRAATEAVAAYRTTFREALEAKFKGAMRTGQLPASVNASALARFYAAVVQGMAVQAADGASAEALDASVDIALRAWPSGHDHQHGPN